MTSVKEVLCDWCNKVIIGKFLTCYYCDDVTHPQCMNDVFHIDGEDRYCCWDCNDDDD